jgi:hypothetical protein
MSKWEDTFANAHKESWPTPNLSIQTSIYERDQREIDAAAKKHGYGYRRHFNKDGIEIHKGIRCFTK